MSKSETLYSLLKIPNNATPQQIKEAYRELAKVYHPDVYQGDKEFATKMMIRLNEARDTLLHPALRMAYDRSLLPPMMRVEPGRAVVPDFVKDVLRRVFGDLATKFYDDDNH